MMELSDAVEIGREALLLTLVAAGPILAAGVLIGLIISVFQAVTQLHDQTFSIVPKIVAMLAAALFFVPWIAGRLIEYTRLMFAGG